METPPGLIARWPGNGNANELAHGRHGSLSGDATYGAGEVSQAFSFDGSGDTVKVPDDREWTLGAAEFTIDLWVNYASDPGGNPTALIAHDQGVGLTPKWILWTASGNLELYVNTYSSGVIPVSAPWSPNAGQWYHVAVTRSEATFRLYVDGQQIGTGTSAAVIPDANAPITLGSAEANFYLNGLLDEPEIFQQALLGSEIQAIFDQGSAARCAPSRSTVTLHADPTSAVPRSTISLTGELSIGGDAAANTTIKILRSVNGGPEKTIKTRLTSSVGSFSFEDEPPEGTITYRATYAGAVGVAADNAWATARLAKRASSLTLEVSKRTINYGDTVTVKAHLKGGVSNRTVTIYAQPKDGGRTALKRGRVNASGILAVKAKPTRYTTYSASYGGDYAWTADFATAGGVSVAGRWTTTMIGGYATVNGYRLYHYSSRCSPTDSTGCPWATFALAPNHAGQRVHFEARFCHEGQCYRDTGSYRLSDKSQVFLYIYYGDREDILGWTISFRYVFRGDGDHLRAAAPWAKARVTA